ncbi:MAG: ABC transporter permease subunit [Actinomycetota bacterium]|nr:ABC transporter permease subunit [Actinomycetota bacterium]
MPVSAPEVATERGATGTVDVDLATGRRMLGRRLRRDRLSVTGLAVVAAFTLAAVAAPLLSGHEPTAVVPADRLLGPSLEHPLGTDPLGRDLLSRLLFGSRWSLGAAAIATVLVMTIGVSMGTVAGYYGGRLDAVVMRVVDMLLGFPSLVLALAIVGTLGPGIVNVMIGLVGVWWVDYARIVRGLVLALREREFVQAARAVGASDRHIMVRHVLPNVVPPVTVLATLEMGQLILAISGLSFLGLGAHPPTPELGAMLNDGRPFLFSAPQLMIYPGAAITLLVMGFNLLGDGLRDVLDPRLQF